jgi:hypothetical protein
VRAGYEREDGPAFRTMDHGYRKAERGIYACRDFNRASDFLTSRCSSRTDRKCFAILRRSISTSQTTAINRFML